MKKRTFYLLLLAITIVGIFFRLYGITRQPLTADDIQMAVTAQNYMERGHFLPTMPHHPNLRNILIFISLKTMGPTVLGVKGFSLVLGVLCVPILGLLLYRVSANMIASCLAAFFLAVDPLHITYSREAIQEVHTAFFFLLGTLLAVSSIKNDERRAIPWLLPLSGMAFGLGLASKAHALFPLAVCLALLLYKTTRQKDLGTAALALLSLTLLPLTVYLITDLPWFLRGYDLSDWIFMKKALWRVMVNTSGPAMETNTDIQAWQWFIVPLLGYLDFSTAGGNPFVIMATGNPLVWLLVLPSSAFLMRKAFKGEGGWLLQALFWTSYLPLVFARRPIFLLSAAAVIPFAFCMVGSALTAWTEKWGEKALFAYLAAVMLVSLLLYPLSTGKALDFGYTRALIERHNPHPEKQGFIRTPH